MESMPRRHACPNAVQAGAPLPAGAAMGQQASRGAFVNGIRSPAGVWGRPTKAQQHPGRCAAPCRRCHGSAGLSRRVCRRDPGPCRCGGGATKARQHPGRCAVPRRHRHGSGDLPRRVFRLDPGPCRCGGGAAKARQPPGRCAVQPRRHHGSRGVPRRNFRRDPEPCRRGRGAFKLHRQRRPGRCVRPAVHGMAGRRSSLARHIVHWGSVPANASPELIQKRTMGALAACIMEMQDNAERGS